MISTYTLSEYTDSDSVVEVSYTNSDGHIHSRVVVLPKDSDGNTDEESLSSILRDQLKSVNDRANMGLLGFRDPNAADPTVALLEDSSSSTEK